MSNNKCMSPIRTPLGKWGALISHYPQQIMSCLIAVKNYRLFCFILSLASWSLLCHSYLLSVNAITRHHHQGNAKIYWPGPFSVSWNDITFGQVLIPPAPSHVQEEHKNLCRMWLHLVCCSSSRSPFTNKMSMIFVGMGRTTVTSPGIKKSKSCESEIICLNN